MVRREQSWESHEAAKVLDIGTIVPKGEVVATNPEVRSLRTVRIALGCGLVGLVSVLMAAFSPASEPQSTVTWDSLKNANPSVLSIEAPIQSLSLTGFSAPDQLTTPITFTGGFFGTDVTEDEAAALRVFLDSSGVTAQLVSPRGQVREIVGPIRVGGGTGGFPSAWEARVENRTLRISSTSQTISTPLPTTDWFKLQVASGWAEMSGSDSYQLTHEVVLNGGSLRAPGALHAWTIWIAVLALLVGLAFLAQPRWNKMRTLITSVVFRRLDWFVLSGIVVSALIAPVAFDDGWELTWGRELVNSPWGPSSPFMSFPGEPVQNPQGFLYYSLLGLTAGQSSLVLGMRSLTMVMLFVTWLLLSRKIIPRIVRHHTSSIVGISGILMILFSYSWMTLRSEIPIALLTAAFFAVALADAPNREALRLAGYSVVAGAAASIHPNGLILFIPWLVFTIRDLRSQGLSLVEKLAALTLGFTAGLTFIFFNLTARLLGTYLSEYPATDFNPFNEWGRFSGIFALGTFTQRAWFISSLIGLLALVVVSVRLLLSAQPRDTRTWVIVTMALMPLGLTLGTSKLPWHYAALAIPSLIGITLIIEWLTSTSRARSLAILTAAGATVWVGLAAKDANIPGTWIGLELDNRPLSPTSLLILTGSTFAVLSSIALSRRWPPLVSIRLAVSIVTATVVLTSFAASLDVTIKSTNGWSFLKQSTLGVFNSQFRCGVANFITLSGDSNMSASTAVKASGYSATLPLHMTLQNPCLPPSGRVEGSWKPALGSFFYERVNGGQEWEALWGDQLVHGCTVITTRNTQSHEICFQENILPNVPVLYAEIVR